MLDNYDSFTYNLVQLLVNLGHNNYEVARSDKIDLEAVEKFDKILLSPGPGLPNDKGIMMDLIKKYADSKSILGVCLGHQAIAESFGAKLHNLEQVKHGVSNKVSATTNDEPLFAGIPQRFKAGHYHSWTVDPKSVNGVLEVIASDEDGLVMAIRHKEYDVKGLQFHPESVMTSCGQKIIDNWIKS